MEGFDSKYALVGFDTSGNLLEIMYNIIDGQTINRVVWKPQVSEQLPLKMWFCKAFA
jgi:hypothetical protein